MREEIVRDEYFDWEEGNEAVQWTSDIAGELVEMGFRITQMTLASVFDESGMIVMRYHSRVSGWREVDPEEAAGPFDTTLTPYPEDDAMSPSRIRVGDQYYPIDAGTFTTEGWALKTTADLDARDHFASEVRELHPTQLDRIEKRLNEIERQLGISGV